MKSARCRLEPHGRTLHVPEGAWLRDVLFEHGLEFPCGGRGACGKCRVRVLEGELAIRDEDRRILEPRLLAAGWRLACHARLEGDASLEFGYWDSHILADDTPIEVRPREGLGVAIDVGTTTLAAQLLDLATGRVLGVRTALNPQARRGADIMSRVQHALTAEGAAELTRLLRDRLEQMLGQLLRGVDSETVNHGGGIREIVLVGNTVMHHSFCGLPLETLAYYPFESPHGQTMSFAADELGWSDLAELGEARIQFLGTLGSFVGSDILAGIVATRLHEREGINILIDLGTNGEMVVGNREGLLCASTAAGPAFEGARLKMGMRADTGAIKRVWVEAGELACEVIGDALPPRGLCGSGVVDAVACGLELGAIRPDGRLNSGDRMLLLAPVEMHQADIRELQLAKGAIAAGVELLCGEIGVAPDAVEAVFLAGAFGNYINTQNAVRIGLLNFPIEKIHPAGNTALLGAKLALLTEAGDEAHLQGIMRATRHLSLNENPEFIDTYVERMRLGMAV